MIVVMKQGAKEAHIAAVVEELEREGMQVQVNQGVDCTVLGVLGDTARVDRDRLSMKEAVDRIVPVSEWAAAPSPSSPGRARWRAQSRWSRWPGLCRRRAQP